MMKRESERRGPTICMFNHECFQRQGEVVGACMDGFLFGTCCELPLTQDSLAHDPLMEQLNGTEQSGQSSLSSAIASQYEKFGSQISAGPTYDPVHLEEPSKQGDQRPGDKVKPTYTKIQNNNYIVNDDLDEDIVLNSISANKYDVANGAVSVYSPSTNKIKTESEELAAGVSLASLGYPSTTESGEGQYGSKDGVYSSELPSLLNAYGDAGSSGESGPSISTETSTDITAAGVQQIANQIFQENSQLFDHSDITHPAAETDLLNEHGSVDNSYANPNDFSGVPQASQAAPTTSKPAKVTYPKPQFKPRPKPSPTPAANDGSGQYVLVQTISNDTKNNETQTKPTVSMNNLPSIESIILMLNDSSVGPQYDTETAQQPSATNATKAPTYETATAASTYGTAPGIDYDRYGPTSFYITKPQKTDAPAVTHTTSNVPSTSYVYSPKPTKRPTLEPVVVQATLLTNGAGYGGAPQADPTPSSTHRPAPTKIIISSSSSSTSKRPILITSDTLASGYYTGPTRPASTVAISSAQPTKKVTTVGTKRPGSTTIKLPEYIVQSSTLSHQNPSTLANVNYIQIASASDNPSPTVHITPKPVVGLVTSSTWNGKPSSATVGPSSSRPGFYENTPPVYLSSMADFEDEGYFGSTSRPALDGTVTSTAIYTIVDGGNKISNFASSTYAPYGPTPAYGPTASYPSRVPPAGPTLQTYGPPAPVEASTMKHELYTTPDDVNNFPPVRNPNLNITEATAMANVTKIQSDYYGEPTNDADKVNMLVNKIVQTFNGNFEELEQILKERNNLTLTATAPAPAPTASVAGISRPSTAADSPSSNSTSTSSTTAKPKKKKKRPSGNRKPANGTTSATKKPTAKPTVLADSVPSSAANGTSVKPSARPSKKPTKVRRPSNSTKPTTSKPSSASGVTTLNKPAANDPPAKPAKPSSGKPKPPASAAAAAAGPTKPKPSSTSTTKKPVRLSSSKRPTRKPSTRPTLADADLTTAQLTTTRKPTKVTKRPTKRPSTTTTSTTTAAPEDETIDEEENAVDGEDEEEEEDEDVGEETNETGDQPAGARKILCGQRPLMKSGRVVGGKASKFGEWPWQVLVRESTWLGLFTKNKCGGVLITNEYVITAAH
uniref:Peptidase S1 domain-containing protein n=1 Tax=Anopheles atroparvus TaxID=41427 RepID=A0AAG5DQX5_ANOAO